MTYCHEAWPSLIINERSGYYCVAGGASMYHTIAHMREAIAEKNFRAVVTDVTHELGVLSVQG